jgi:hypothetical protein
VDWIDMDQGRKPVVDYCEEGKKFSGSIKEEKFD